MRENTERPVTITMGTNVLVGTSRDRIVHAADRILDSLTRPRTSAAPTIPPLWDGHAAERIIDVLLSPP